jgi:aminomuconate-semialdehyde/2-hydroxymuconate-6-semialdehyde dehydrogenase
MTPKQHFSLVINGEPADAADGKTFETIGMVWTNLNRAHQVASPIRSGLVWVNGRARFGGAKRSGLGREGGYHSREFFTEAKTVTIALT